MNILVVNDDGYDSPGLRALVKALDQDHEVYVSVPDGQRSGKSQGITVGDLVYVEEREMEGARDALVTTGTPADCTKIGLQFLAERGTDIDLVVSGINLGTNMGIDTLYSGTVGAATEAAIDRVHAIAVSVSGHHASHFDAPCALVRQVIPLALGLSPEIVVNLNFPDIPAEDLKGVLVTRLGRRNFIDRFVLQEGGGYRLCGHPQDFTGADRAIDLGAVAQGYASVTPLLFDRTAEAVLPEVSGWGLTL